MAEEKTPEEEPKKRRGLRRRKKDEPAAERGEKESSALASSMCLPRTWSATSRTLRGETRTNLAEALTSTSSVPSLFAERATVTRPRRPCRGP